MWLAGSGVVEGRSDEPFQIMVANLTGRTIYLLPNQVLIMESSHPETLVEVHLSNAKAFGSMLDDSNKKFQKRQASAHEMETIKQHLADHGGQLMV